MPIIRAGWELDISVKDVLFAQAADAAVLSRRSPRLIEVAEKAIKDAHDLISPLVIFQEVGVESFQNGKYLLHAGYELSGSLIGEHLMDARSVIAVVCTIGGKLETRASSISSQDMTYGYALDSAGSVAVDMLAGLAYSHFESLMETRGWKTSIAMNPGMIGWPLQQGQTQIFSILADENHAVHLSDSGLMTPLKSISMVIGAGPNIQRKGQSCDFCALNGICQYQKPCNSAVIATT